MIEPLPPLVAAAAFVAAPAPLTNEFPFVLLFTSLAPVLALTHIYSLYGLMFTPHRRVSCVAAACGTGTGVR